MFILIFWPFPRVWFSKENAQSKDDYLLMLFILFIATVFIGPRSANRISMMLASMTTKSWEFPVFWKRESDTLQLLIFLSFYFYYDGTWICLHRIAIRYISCYLMSSEQMVSSIREEIKFSNKNYKAKRLILQCINGASSN